MLTALSGFAGTITSTTTGGNWSSTSTWLGGNLPSASDEVVINGNVTLNGNYTVRSITINSGKTLTSQNANARILTLSNNSWGTCFTNNGSFIANDGTVVFNASANGLTVSGTTVFFNVTLNNVNQMNFGGSATINGTLTLNNGAFLSSSNRPNYGANGTLYINSTYGSNKYMMDNNFPDGNGSTTPPNIYFNVTPTSFNTGKNITLLKSVTVAPGVTWNIDNTCIYLAASFTGITNNGTVNLGDVTVQSGCTWNVNSNYAINRLKIESGATVNAGSYTLTFNTNNNTGSCFGSSTIIEVVPGGTFNKGTSTVNINPVNTMNIVGNITFNNVVVQGQTVNTSSGDVHVAGSYTNMNSGSVSGVVLDSGSTNTNIGSVNVINASSGGGSQAGALALLAPNTYTISSSMTLTGTRKVFVVNAGSELITGGYGLTADSIYVYGKLTLSNSGGLATFLGSTKIVLGNSSTVEYAAASGTQTITATTYGNLTLSGAATKTFTGTYTVSGNFLVAGGGTNFSAAPSFTFNGGNQSIAGLPYKHVTFSGSGLKTLTDTAKVTGVVTLSGGATLISSGLLTLVSDASGTASIGPITGGASLTGNINYQRFIPALSVPQITSANRGKLWRFIGWPINGNTVANTWQQNIYITGSGSGGGSLGTTNSNGFDWTASNAPSLYYYKEDSTGVSSNRWALVNNTNTAISSTRGYRLFVRGDRSQGQSQLSGSSYTPTAVTLKGSGTINQGDVTVSLNCSNGCTSNDGWQLLSNPYPSAIDWNASSWVSARSASIQSAIYVYNPSSNVYGSYSPTGGSVNGVTSNIASGQSFWVKTTGNASLTFKEDYKISNATAGVFGKTNGDPLTNNLKIQIGEAGKIYDECVIYMYPYAQHTLDAFDGLSPNSGPATISSYSREREALVFNAIPFLRGEHSDTIPLNTPMSAADWEYQLTFEGYASFKNPATRIFLLDRYLNISVPIHASQPGYRFTSRAGRPESYSAERFSIILSTATAKGKVFDPITFTAKQKDARVELNWTIAVNTSGSAFDVLKSRDGVTFTSIGNLPLTGERNYTFIDSFPGRSNHYRIQLTDLSGDSIRSASTVVLNSTGLTTETVHPSSIALFPNPAVAYIAVQFGNRNTGSTEITIVDMTGKEMYHEQIRLDERYYTHEIDVAAFDSGVYFVKVDHSETLRFLKK